MDEYLGYMEPYIDEHWYEAIRLANADTTIEEGCHAHLCPNCKLDVEYANDTTCPLTEHHDHLYCSEECALNHNI